MQLTNPKTAAVIESRFEDHAAAAENLACLLAAGEFGTGDAAEFPQSLVHAAEQHGQNLSPGRAFWLHKLANEGRAKPMVAGTFNADRFGLPWGNKFAH